MLSGLTAELFYVRDGQINFYALNFVVPVPATIGELHFTWQSLTRRPVRINCISICKISNMMNVIPMNRCFVALTQTLSTTDLAEKEISSYIFLAFLAINKVLFAFFYYSDHPLLNSNMIPKLYIV